MRTITFRSAEWMIEKIEQLLDLRSKEEPGLRLNLSDMIRILLSKGIKQEEGDRA